ncbi:hypothetical protein C8J56DRAFT_1023157 [Mycena floridula]|nr:hypothetical protein C8J56DRAFT_1023157 [Mycena floridula]
MQTFNRLLSITVLAAALASTAAAAEARILTNNVPFADSDSSASSDPSPTPDFAELFAAMDGDQANESPNMEEAQASLNNFNLVGKFAGANNAADGYMGCAALNGYNVEQCLRLCETRGADHRGGQCQYVNIWQGKLNGKLQPNATCAMYWIPLDNSTATNYGQHIVEGDLVVTSSAGYARKTFVKDGGFESYTCVKGGDFCYSESSVYWKGTSPPRGHWDALIFNAPDYAHTGHSVGTLGSGDGADSLSGTFTPKSRISTTKNAAYCLQFWHSSDFNGELEDYSILQIGWNSQVIDTIRPGDSPWKVYSYTVIGTGSDLPFFTGGRYPAYSFIDDISLFVGACTK